MKNNEMINKRKIIYKVLDLYEETFENYESSYYMELEVLSDILSKLDFRTIDNYYDAIKIIIKKYTIKESVIQMLESENRTEKIMQRIVVENLEEILKNIELDKESEDIKSGKLDLKDIGIENIEKEHILAKYSYILKSSNEDFNLVEKRIKKEIIDYFENQNIYKFYNLYKLFFEDLQIKRTTKNKHR